MTIALLRERSSRPLRGDDPDPYSAIMDALGERPTTRSSSRRIPRPARLAAPGAGGPRSPRQRRPVEHVVVDIDAERDDVKRTLVVATRPSRQELIATSSRSRGRAARLPRHLPASDEAITRTETRGRSPQRLAHTLSELQEAGLQAVGQVAFRPPIRPSRTRAVLRPGRHRCLHVPRDALRLAASDLIGRIRRPAASPWST